MALEYLFELDKLSPKVEQEIRVEQLFQQAYLGDNFCIFHFSIVNITQYLE